MCVQENSRGKYDIVRLAGEKWVGGPKGDKCQLKIKIG